jgi:hypothetical protein
LEGDAHQRGDGVHEAADGGAFFGHGDEDFAGGAVVVEADGDVAFVAGDVELVSCRVARVRGGGGAGGRSTIRSTIFSMTWVWWGAGERLSDVRVAGCWLLVASEAKAATSEDTSSRAASMASSSSSSCLVEVLVGLDVEGLAEFAAVAIEGVGLEA